MIRPDPCATMIRAACWATDEAGGEVRVDDAPPFVDRELEEGLAHDHGGVVDQDVEAAEARSRIRDALADGVRVRDVEDEGGGLGSGIL